MNQNTNLIVGVVCITACFVAGMGILLELANRAADEDSRRKSNQGRGR